MVCIKKYIEFFYNLKNISVIKKNSCYHFAYDHHEYLFFSQERNIKELMEVFSITNQDDNYDNIIKNKYNDIVSIINNKSYILVKKSKKVNLLETILQSKQLNNNYSYNLSINRSNWSYLWSKKIDYIEYQMIHIIDKYDIIRDSIWYYIGMAEVAISYIYNTPYESQLVISHKRIITDDLNNPLNIIVDNKSRDVAEYLKYIFLCDSYDYRQIYKLFNNLNEEFNFYKLLYGRMFFPTFYFDIYDSIINAGKGYTSIKKIINRSQEYEDYLKNIYKIIINFANIDKVDWL